MVGLLFHVAEHLQLLDDLALFLVVHVFGFGLLAADDGGLADLDRMLGQPVLGEERFGRIFGYDTDNNLGNGAEEYVLISAPWKEKMRLGFVR